MWARFRRESGETIKSIAESLNRNLRTISKWCEGIKPPSPAESDILGLLSDGEVVENVRDCGAFPVCPTARFEGYSKFI